jgi:hypothetical protein
VKDLTMEEGKKDKVIEQDVSYFDRPLFEVFF